MTPMARLSSRLIFLRWVPGFALMNSIMRTLLGSWICTTSADCAFARSTDTVCWGVKNVWGASEWNVRHGSSEGLRRMRLLCVVLCGNLKEKREVDWNRACELHSACGLEQGEGVSVGILENCKVSHG